MQKHVTIKDIARALGISKSTVSRALGDRFDVNADTREAVLDMARRLNYKPNPYAQSLIRRRSRIVGVVVPEFVNSFFPRIIMEMQKVFEAEGFRVLITQSGESAEVERRNLELLEQSMVEGIVISIARKDENLDYYRRLAAEGIPLVFFNRACSGVDAGMVIIDDRRMAAIAVEHLITGLEPGETARESIGQECGHERPGGRWPVDAGAGRVRYGGVYGARMGGNTDEDMCGGWNGTGRCVSEAEDEYMEVKKSVGEMKTAAGEVKGDTVEVRKEAADPVLRRRIMHLKGPEDIYSSVLRYEGYRDALRRFGLPVEGSLVVCCGEITREAGYEAMDTLIRGGGMDADGIFAFNDQLAIGALKALREHGLRVPQDVAVVGFSESQSALLTSPPLSSVAQPLGRIGEAAARMLLGKIEHPERPDRVEVLEAKLNVRESSRII